jgi:GTPase SAR1 family protein
LILIDTPGIPHNHLYNPSHNNSLLDLDIQVNHNNNNDLNILISEIKEADVVLVCFDMFVDCLDGLLNGYLPFLSDINGSVPIVIVGTKLDIYMNELNANNIVELEDSEYWG